MQKKEKERDFREWQRSEGEIRKAEEDTKTKEQINKVEKFERSEISGRGVYENKDNLLSKDELEQKKALEVLLPGNSKPFVRSEAKKDWIQTSFWVPEMTPGVKKELKTKPDMRLDCPAKTSDDHKVKVKRLVSLKLNTTESDEYQCYLCKRALCHQKIAALRGCGHTMCLSCITKYCSEEKQCIVCNKAIKSKKDIIELQESGTAYSSHSKVETQISKPVFNC